MFKPYTPYSILKQTWCSALHPDKRFTLDEHQRQNKDSKGPEDAVICYMALKECGKVKNEFTCTASGLKKGHTKLSLGILRQMFGPEKVWKKLCEEIEKRVIDARNERGAGPKIMI